MKEVSKFMELVFGILLGGIGIISLFRLSEIDPCEANISAILCIFLVSGILHIVSFFGGE